MKIKMLTGLCLALLLLGCRERVEAMDLIVTNTCRMIGDILYFDVRIHEQETTDLLKIKALLGVDNAGIHRSACLPSLFTNINSQVFTQSPYLTTFSVDTTLTSPVDMLTAGASTATTCDVTKTNTAWAFNLVATPNILYATNLDEKYPISCDTAGPLLNSPVIITPDVSAFAGAITTGTVRKVAQSIVLVLFDCSDQYNPVEITPPAFAPPASPVPVVTLAMGSQVCLGMRYTFDDTNAQVGLDAIAVKGYSCDAYDSDPTVAPAPIVPIIDVNSCPDPPSNGQVDYWIPQTGMTGPISGTHISSPFLTMTGPFLIAQFRTSADVWIVCQVIPCTKNNDPLCYGPPSCGFPGKRKRAADFNVNSTETVSTKILVLSPAQIAQMEGRINNGGQMETGKISCFQDASFIVIVVVMLVLVLVAMCVSLVLCYKLRNRRHPSEKMGMSNPGM